MSYSFDILISHLKSDALRGAATAEVNFAAGLFARGALRLRAAPAHGLAWNRVELKEFGTTN